MYHSDLVPYDESMQLGQGYNSFLHIPCIYGAVRVDEDAKLAPSNSSGSDEVSQVVSYSSRVLTRASEVTHLLHVSAGSSIKNGGILSSGHQSAVDDAKIDSSDLSVLISVKVTNETKSFDTQPEFNLINGVLMEDKQADSISNFHKAYGDSYISAFVTGGEFHAILSIKVLDNTQKVQIISNLKQELSKKKSKSGEEAADEMRQLFAPHLRKTETSISVYWRGGGQIKKADEQWDISSLFTAAASFPNKVATNSQRCWAILTRYPNNQSFLDKCPKVTIRDYSKAQQYANDLLDSFVQYKSCILRIKDALDQPLNYICAPGMQAIAMRAEALVLVRHAIKKEMVKIVETIEKIDRDPENAHKIFRAAEIAAPELWSAQLPVLNTTATDVPEAHVDDTHLIVQPDHVLSILKMFSLHGPDGTNSDQVAEHLAGVMTSAKKPATSGLRLPGIDILATPETQEEMNDAEKEIVNSGDNRRKWAPHLLFDKPSGCGGADQLNNFNHAEMLAQGLEHRKWPIRLQVKMVKVKGKVSLGLCQLDYDDLQLSAGGIKGRGGLVRYGALDIKIGPSRRITHINIGWVEEGRVKRINQVEVWLETGERKHVPGGNSEVETGTCFTKYNTPPGMRGLKGFYGHETNGEKIERIGLIWGM